MAKVTEDVIEDLSIDDLDFDDVGPEDYVFIVRSDGTLKNVIFPPTDAFEYSTDLLKLFELFGVDNPDELLGNITLH
jgi:hypothetical protein